MAHVAKYSRGALGHMLGHYDRSKDNLSGNIDSERTPENYNLAVHQPLQQMDFIHQRLSEVKVPTRKDLNVICDWVITLPKDIDRADSKEFMDSTYCFMVARYGEQNVISAYVHMDEAQPHLHFAFVPVVEDRKHGGFKVSAKDAVTRHDLQTFHKDLDRYMERAYGRNIGILNEATKEGNKSIEELKRGTAQKQLQQLYQECATIAQEARTAMQELQDMQKALSSLQAQREALERQIEAYMKMRGAVIPVKERKNLSGKVVEVTMTKEIYDACVSAQMRADHADLRAREAERELQRVQRSSSSEENARLSNELSEAWKKIAGLRQQNREYGAQIDSISAVFVRNPDLLEKINESLGEIAEENRHHIGLER